MTELDAFIQWRDQQQHRITGWTIWMASLAHRGVTDTQSTRPDFKEWLASVRLTDWIDFDAWMAAARYAERLATMELISVAMHSNAASYSAGDS